MRLYDLLPESWKSDLDRSAGKNIEVIINEIDRDIGKSEISPAREKIFSAFNIHLSSVKVVILGQDPYPQNATGLAFEVGSLDSWSKPIKQKSLSNILKLLYSMKSKDDPYEITLETIREEIVNNKFKILSPDKLFNYWSEQGVLLLNTSLTYQKNCRVNKWSSFIKIVIEAINGYNKKINWFLWGKKAEKFENIIKGENKFKSRHPMLCSKKYIDDFLKNECFNKTKDLIDWTGLEKNKIN